MAFEVTYSGKPILLIANLCFDPFKIVGRDLKKKKTNQTYGKFGIVTLTKHHLQ